MKDYLKLLGVRSDLLSKEEKIFLDVNGYLNLGKVLSDEQIETILDRIDVLLQDEGVWAGSELADSPHIRYPKEAGANRLADLVNKGGIFDLFYTNPKVLASIAHVLGQCIKLSSLNYRAALPGDGLQKLHVDWAEPIDSGDYKVCNSIWLLDDFTKENGSTRIVPGTNHSKALPQAVLKNPMATHPDEMLIEAPAGTVVVFNSHTWHGGTKNNTKLPRRAIHSYFCRRDQPQQIDQSRYIKNETRNRIGQVAEYLLDV